MVAGLVQWALAVGVGVVQLMAYVSSPLVFLLGAGGEVDEASILSMVTWPLVVTGTILLAALSAIYCEMFARSLESRIPARPADTV